jgi:hypothetical protein
MDAAILARDVTTFLVPVLPYLLKSGEEAAKEVGKNVGGEVWSLAKALWSTLSPKVETKPAAMEAAQDSANAPGDDDAVASLRVQLKKLLTDDPDLAAKIDELWQQGKTIGLTNVVAGTRAVVTSGDVKDSAIVTGDRNQVTR